MKELDKSDLYNKDYLREKQRIRSEIEDYYNHGRIGDEKMSV